MNRRRNHLALGSFSLLALVVSGAFSAAHGQSADPTTSLVELEPVTGANYGHGYDVTRRLLFAQGGGCVSYDPARTYASGESWNDSNVELVSSSSSISRQMNLSVSASVSVSLLVAGGSVSSNTSFAQSVSASNYSQTLFAYSFARDIPTFIDASQIRIKPEYLEMLKDPGRVAEFRSKCGDSFVVGIRRGSEFYGAGWAEQQSMESWTKFQQMVQASASVFFGAVSVSTAVEYGKAMSQAFSMSSIRTKVRMTNTVGQQPTDIVSMLDLFRIYNAQSGPRTMLTFYAAPYWWAENYPETDPIALTPNEEGMGALSNALWDLRTLIADADFIKGHPDQFAMGTSDAKRKSRLAAVTQARDRWYSEAQSLQAKAKACLTSFDAACGDLSSRYAARDLLLERGVLPTRYRSDCRRKYEIDGTELGLKVGSLTMPSNSIKGDTAINGSRTEVRGDLTFSVSGRKLMAKFVTTLRETTADNTTFRGEINKPVVDLASAQDVTTLLGGASLDECDFVGSGVTAPLLPPLPSLAIPPHTGLVHGSLAVISGNDQQLVRRWAPGMGVLVAMNCEVDKQGDDGGLLCEAPELTPIELTLVNRTDVEAESWTPSPLGVLPPAFLQAVNSSAMGPQGLIATKTLTGNALHAQLVRLAIDRNKTLGSKRLTDLRSMSGGVPSGTRALLAERFSRLRRTGATGPLPRQTPPMPAPAAPSSQPSIRPLAPVTPAPAQSAPAPAAPAPAAPAPAAPPIMPRRPLVPPAMPAAAMRMEQDVDRGGSDYSHFPLADARPELCRDACSKDPNCRAFTYVKPNFGQGPRPMCWLKNAVPAAKRNPCCVSGVKQ